MTVGEWASDFIKFMAEFSEHDDQIKNQNIISVVGSALESLQTAVAVAANGGNIAMGSPEYVELFKAFVQRESDAIIQKADFLTDDELDSVLGRHGHVILGLASQFSSSFQDVELKKQIDIYVVALLAKLHFSPGSMGFVVAGYGSNDIFPAFTEVETDGYIGTKLRLSRKETVVTREKSAFIKPFAQFDMVQRFMNGADPEYWSFSNALYHDAMIANCLEVLEAYGADGLETDEARSAIRQAVDKSVEKAIQEIMQFQKVNFSGPIIDMVKVLPKDELPHLAESLVALTSLKRHVSHDAETVGGPIDVALISKGDGLVWIRRKHYFKAELNPQFFMRYRSDGGGNEEQRSAARSAAKGASRRSKPS